MSVNGMDGNVEGEENKMNDVGVHDLNCDNHLNQFNDTKSDLDNGIEPKEVDSHEDEISEESSKKCCKGFKCTRQIAKKMSICIILSLIGLICFGTRNWLLSFIATYGPERTDIVSSVWGWGGTGILGGLLWLILIPTKYRIHVKPVGTKLKDFGCGKKKRDQTISDTNQLEGNMGREAEVVGSSQTSSVSSDPIDVAVTTPMIGTVVPIKYRFGGWEYLFPLFLGGIGSAIGLVTINVAYSMAPESKGQTTAITSSVSAFVVLFAFLVLREMVTVWQGVGIGITIIGVIMISVGASESADFIAFAFGILTAVLGSVCNVAIGYCAKKGMNKLSNGIVLSVMISVDWVIGLPVLALVFGSPIYGLNTWMIFASIGAGALTTLGLITQNIAIGLWSTGAVSAITNSNAVIVMFWDWVIYGKFYSALAISGVFIVLAGTAVLALSPKSKKRWGTSLCKRKKKETTNVEDTECNTDGGEAAAPIGVGEGEGEEDRNVVDYNVDDKQLSE